MAWLTPGAFAALVLLSGPVIVHLLARRNARRVVFPATHFVRATHAAAVRLRPPSDLGLLLLRLAIVIVAVLAAAHPLVLTPWRLAQWNARVARAVLVDTSRSVPEPQVAARLAEAETRDVFAARRIDTPDLADGLERAVRWLQSVPPSRREVVIVSDFQRGALDAEILKAVPRDIGVRLTRAGGLPRSGRASAPPVEGWRGGIWQASTTIDATGTRASWVRRGDAAAPHWISVMASPADEAAATRALQAMTSLGVPAGDDSRRVIVRFAGAAALRPPAAPIESRWIAAAALALRGSDLLREVESGVKVSERDGVMVVDAPMAAAALAAPAVIRAVLLAVRPAAIIDSEAEVVSLPDAVLARWRRDPAPVTGQAVPVPGDSDARWLWALALVLLAIEGRVRARRTAGGQAHDRALGERAHADAA